jgi:ABC-type lipoprotein export system ATPase subunit
MIGKPRISLKHVSKSYTSRSKKEEGRMVLSEVDAEFEAGLVHLILGPSGCGKTTLLNIIGGFDTPDTGEVWVDDFRVDTLDQDRVANFRAGRIGVMFQNPNLIGYLTALENVLLPAYFVGRGLEMEDALSLMKSVNIDGRASALPSDLSEGERRRVSFARALMLSPKFILADEPTVSVDEANKKAIVAALREASRRNGACVLIATHDTGLLEFADRTYRLFSGKLMNGVNESLHHG